MKYRAEITAPAEAELQAAYQWIARDSPAAAERWRKGIYDVARSLETLPFRYGLAPENAAVDFELRQYVYKSHRILYTVIDKTVYILHVRHGARQFMQPVDVKGPTPE
jgi:plasmid stabilization system protein ParE